MKWSLLPVCVINCLPAFSQVVHHSPDLYFTGSGAYSRESIQSFSFLCNQASLAALPQPGAGFFTEQRFGLPQLAVHLAAAAVPVKGGGVGVALQYSGFSAFNQSCASLAYGKNLGRVGVGIQFNYTRISMPGYGNDAAMGVEISSRWSLTSKLITGIRVANPFTGKFQQAKHEKLAAVVHWGAGYEASEQVYISMEIIKEENRGLHVLAGVQYTVIDDKLFTRVGIATGTHEPFFSAGWQWRNCRAAVMVRHHPQLGVSPGLLLLFFGKRKSE